MSRLVDVYPYCKQDNQLKLLLFKRAKDVMYAGHWRMIGGKVTSSETAAEAARRELKEETGHTPDLFWTVPSVNCFYDPHSDTVRKIPAFAAELTQDGQVILNHEHIDYKWISPDSISDYINWPEQRRLMKLVTRIVINNEIIDEWIL